SLLRASLAAAPPPTDLPALAAVTDETIDGPHGPVPVRRYLPSGERRGTCVYLHAGGWMIGDLDFADATCRRLAGASGAEIVSVDYRLAPEHPFPQPLDDAYAALRWAARACPGPLALAGESAGGNLAAACAIRARDTGGPSLVGLFLAYPVTDHDLDTASHREVGVRNWLLSTADMRWFWDHYAPPGTDRGNPLLSPLRVADAAGLPPAMILVAELDPLRDEGLAFAAKLSAAGVPTATRSDPGMLHGYLGAAGAVPLAAEALKDAATWLRERLAITL
ncbi:MAG: alpha/beta hydrolase, partial [Sphingomonadales bacterium]